MPCGGKEMAKKRDAARNIDKGSSDKLVNSVLELHKQKHRQDVTKIKQSSPLRISFDKFRGLLGRQLKDKIQEADEIAKPTNHIKSTKK